MFALIGIFLLLFLECFEFADELFLSYFHHFDFILQQSLLLLHLLLKFPDLFHIFLLISFEFFDVVFQFNQQVVVCIRIFFYRRLLSSWWFALIVETCLRACSHLGQVICENWLLPVLSLFVLCLLRFLKVFLRVITTSRTCHEFSDIGVASVVEGRPFTERTFIARFLPLLSLRRYT